QTSAGAAQTLGMFVNTLPLRLQLRDMTTKELVEHTQRELVELLSQEQASLAAAQHCSGIPGGAALFTALLNYRHSVRKVAANSAGAENMQVLMVADWTTYPITLSIDDFGDGFALKAQTYRPINPHRLMGYLRTAVCSLIEALETAPLRLASMLPI